MKNIASALILTAATMLMSVTVFAQETDIKVVDEGVVQVNDVVITLSRINREIENAVESLVREGKSREDAVAEIESKKGRLIASIIEEELIMQKGNEMGFERDVEARINQQFLEQMREFNMKNLDELYAAMRQNGIEPEDIRTALRSQITREWVFQSQVDEPIRWNISDGEIKDYFGKHKEKFIDPETVTLSEIFLSFAGKNENAVRQKAAEIVKRLRAGEDFATLAIENSDRPTVAQDKGVVGKVNVNDLTEVFVKPLENVKVGGVTDPIELEVGMEILRVDARSAQGTESNFDENKVRLAILRERVPPARKQFLKELKEDAYIKIAESYRPLVTPFLFQEDTPEDTTASN